MPLKFGSNLFGSRGIETGAGMFSVPQSITQLRGKAAGTLTVTSTDTGAYSVYVDVLIDKGELEKGDIIQILLFHRVDSGAGQNLNWGIKIMGLSAEPGLGGAIASGNWVWDDVYLAEDPELTDRIRYSLREYEAAASISEGTLDTNDTDVFPRQFTIRIGGWMDAAAAAGGWVSYVVKVNKQEQS